jgi:hypothetical protein
LILTVLPEVIAKWAIPIWSGEARMSTCLPSGPSEKTVDGLAVALVEDDDDRGRGVEGVARHFQDSGVNAACCLKERVWLQTLSSTSNRVG